MDNNNTETLNVDILSHAVTKKYDILNCTTPFSGEFYRRMFFIVREPCSFSIKVNVTGKIKRLKNRSYGYNYYAKKTSLLFSAAAITLTLIASSASAATPTAAQNEVTSTVKQEITEGINRYLYSIDKADPTLGKQLFMFHRKPVLFIHAVTNADGRRSLKIFMAPLWVKLSVNAH